MSDTILKATNSSFQKGMTFCRSIYVKKVMKLLAFIFEQPSYHIVGNLMLRLISQMLHTSTKGIQKSFFNGFLIIV